MLTACVQLSTSSVIACLACSPAIVVTITKGIILAICQTLTSSYLLTIPCACASLSPQRQLVIILGALRLLLLPQLQLLTYTSLTNASSALITSATLVTAIRLAQYALAQRLQRITIVAYCQRCKVLIRLYRRLLRLVAQQVYCGQRSCSLLTACVAPNRCPQGYYYYRQYPRRRQLGRDSQS